MPRQITLDDYYRLESEYKRWTSDWHRLNNENERLRAERDRLQQANVRLREEYGELHTEYEKLRRDLSVGQKAGERFAGNVPSVSGQRKAVLHPEQYEAAMISILSDWWQERHPNRERLRDLIEHAGLPAKFYTMKGIEAVMQSVKWDGPYAFQPSEKDGGWLWCDFGSNGEALVLPADPDFFVTDSIQKILQRMITGCENVSERPRFRKAFNACRVLPDLGGGYRVLTKGVIWIEGQPEPPGYGAPSAQKPAVSGPLNSPSSSEAQMEAARVLQTAANLLREAIAKLPSTVQANGHWREPIDGLRGEIQGLRGDIQGLRELVMRIPQSAAAPPPECSSNPASDQDRADRSREMPLGEWWSQSECAGVYQLVKFAVELTYIARLKALQEALALAFPEIAFQISHLALEASGRFTVYPAEPADDGCVKCGYCGNTAESQFFLTGRSGASGPVYVLLAPGAMQEFGFPRGYALLLDPAPSRSFVVASVSEPAVLIESGQGDDLTVKSRMRWSGPPG